MICDLINSIYYNSWPYQLYTLYFVALPTVYNIIRDNTAHTILRDNINCIHYTSWPHQLHTKCFVTSPQVSLASSLLHTVVHIINTRGTRYYNDFFFFSDLPKRDNQVTDRKVELYAALCKQWHAYTTKEPFLSFYSRGQVKVCWRWAYTFLGASQVYLYPVWRQSRGRRMWPVAWWTFTSVSATFGPHRAVVHPVLTCGGCADNNLNFRFESPLPDGRCGAVVAPRWLHTSITQLSAGWTTNNKTKWKVCEQVFTSRLTPCVPPDMWRACSS